MARHNSLSDYASKRFRLAGKAVLDFGNPFFAPIDRLGQDAERRGKPFVSFANYDYLGLATHPRVKADSAAALESLGVGALASRLVGGERSTHQLLEEELASFLGTETSLSLVSGYLTNLTTITHLMAGRDALFIDELSHNSIVSAAKSSGAAVVVFRHNDLDHLDELLANNRENYRNVLIIAEALYSMDGDIADLPRLVEVKERHQAWLLVDEAHSLGVLGATGRGICEHAGVDPNRVDLIIGTMSKTLASCGGFIAAKRSITDWMRYTLPGFVYSVGLSPVIVAAARAALQLMQEEAWRIERLARNAEMFRDCARQAGLDTGPAIGRGVVPILFASSQETMLASQHLLEQGFYCPPIVQIGVPKDQPRLRFFISASHTEDDIRRVIAALETRPVVAGEMPAQVATAAL
ncbi:MAG: aminotransferase class I/II-fold pyridoxal phosphate-dependent enzyme [Methylobacteriaceae bacterium]|nr:aminotransferase class I/II-fold pyridoxal phosphate-dependent enzyme [Methylobacteriaceae bacterium]